MSKLSIGRRELVRRALTACARIQLKLTQCGGCLGWHLPDDNNSNRIIVEMKKDVAMRMILAQWRPIFQKERRALRLAAPLGGRYETDWFPVVYENILSRVKALRMLEAEYAGEPLSNKCRRDSNCWTVRRTGN